MDDNHFREVQTQWFSSLHNLVELRIHRNSIQFIPDGTFEPLTSIQNLVMGENPLQFIGIEAFGSNSLASLNWLSLVNAGIEAFDVEIFSRAKNLNMLYLYNNPCISLNFYNIRLERDNVREQLQQCFDSFAGSLSCEFFEMTGNE